MAAPRTRVRRLHILEKAVGIQRMSRIQSTGLTPAVLQGAAVMGAGEHILKPVRICAGVLAGVKAGGCFSHDVAGHATESPL